MIGVLDLGCDVFVFLPFSRLHETEADELGLATTIRPPACADPRAAIRVWNRMAEQKDKKVPLLGHRTADCCSASAVLAPVLAQLRQLVLAVTTISGSH